MSKPNFLIPGIARCGSTSLYYYLKQHPDISFSVKKEPKFFSSMDIQFPHTGPGDDTVDRQIITSKKKYYELFNALNTKWIGEASSDYFYYHQSTIARIKENLGDIPIIILIRNPIERAFSAYSNLLRDSRESLSFELAILEEESRLAANYDWMWAYKSGSLYADGINSFQKCFSRTHVILFDDLAANPQKVLKDCLEFLEISTDFEFDTTIKYSHSGQPTNRLAKVLANRKNNLVFTARQAAIKIIPRSILEHISSVMFRKDHMPKQVRNRLHTYFKEDIRKVEELIGKDLSHWK